MKSYGNPIQILASLAPLARQPSRAQPSHEPPLERRRIRTLCIPASESLGTTKEVLGTTKEFPRISNAFPGFH